MIRVRRAAAAVPWVRRYELQLLPKGSATTGAERLTLGRGASVRRLEVVVGVGDAWSFIGEADRQWEAGNRGWAVEFEESGS